MRIGIYYVAVAVLIFSVLLLLPVAVALFGDDFQTGFGFLIYSAFGLFLSIACLLSLRGKNHDRLSRAGGFILICFIWLLYPAIATLILVDLTGLSWWQAWFEAVSGLTTSGASGFSNKSVLPPSLLIWRSQLEWIGGLLTIAMVIFCARVKYSRQDFLNEGYPSGQML